MREINETEESYTERIRAMSGKERVAIAMRLTDEYRQTVESQVKQENPLLEGELLKIAVAERIYGSDPGALALLQSMKQKLLGINGNDDGETLPSHGDAVG